MQGGPARVGNHACCLCPGLPPEHRELSVDTLQYCFHPDLHQPGPHGSLQFLPGPPSILPCLTPSQVEAAPVDQCSSCGTTWIFQVQPLTQGGGPVSSLCPPCPSPRNFPEVVKIFRHGCRWLLTPRRLLWLFQVYAMTLCAFLWFAIHSYCGLDRKGRYSLTPR